MSKSVSITKYRERVLKIVAVYREINELKAEVTFHAAGLSLAEFAAMCVIYHGGDVHPHEIARRLGTSRTTVTHALKTLDERRWLSTTIDKDDRRRVSVKLNARGRAFFTRSLRDLILLDDDRG